MIQQFIDMLLTNTQWFAIVTTILALTFGIVTIVILQWRRLR